MKRNAIFTCLVLALALSVNAFADDGDDLLRPHDGRGPDVWRSETAVTAKAARDTARLIGPPALGPVVNGTFQDAGGAPAWNGWTTLDWTVPDTTDFTWHVSDYFAINGTYSAYCGDETIPSCGPGDPVGGYENSWDKLLKWGATVADPGLSTNITVSFAFDVDSESGYDWGRVSREIENEESETIWGLSGDSTGTITVPVTYASGEYFGEFTNEIGILFIGHSDGGWSDGDCSYPSSGLWRIDDVTITADNGAGGAGPIDFEDGTLGDLERKYLGAVGDFTHLASNLGDPDLCASNGTPQVTFIDDGVVQPATGGSFATADNRKYAMGYVVNYTGGLTFSEQRHLRNTVVSPAIPWQDPSHDGGRVVFTDMTDSFHQAGQAGVYVEWMIRSTTGDAASIENAIWQQSPHVYTGGPYYNRPPYDVSDNLVQGRTYVQFGVGATEIGYVWGVDGHNGSPSPYFDNVRLESFPFEGPSLSMRTYRLAGDAFPEIGIVDTADLSRNSIRFDQAQNISPTPHEWYYNGDSVNIDAVAVRTGAEMTSRPSLHYKLKRNSLFDPYRTAGMPDSGVVVMDTTYTPTGTVVADRFSVDLPDTGFLFPGDILQYYFSAEDAIGGAGGTDPFTSTLPGDLDDFGNFDDPEAWFSTFTVRGLPTVVEDIGNPGTYICPSVIFWDDAESDTRGTRNEWYGAFNSLGLIQGEDYDTFYARGPSSGVGTGISRKASTNQLGWYDDLIYSSAYLTTSTISNGDWGVGGDDDITRVENWLDLSNKDMFVAGNSVCMDLNNSGAAAQAFMTTRMGVTFNAENHRDLLGGQLAPRVLAVAGNAVLNTVNSWIAFGGCPQLWDFDLVTPSGSTRLAEYANATGTPGGYPYSAMTLNVLGTGSRVITLNSDLAYIHTDANESVKADATLPGRVRLLRDVLNYFGVADNPGQATEVPVAGQFVLRNSPNPFNPITKISYTIKAPGHLMLKVFNVRGELVKTLIDGHVASDGFVEWDGTNGQGGKVSSGVYFYQAQMGNDVQVRKMALVK
ncbi:MAG: hypothetical protein GY838_15075 [bacterium]|nr:hypothetical protein [bacterium]